MSSTHSGPTGPATPLTLGADFPAPSHDQWMALVERLLKGGDFDKRLMRRTYDGIAVPPLVTRQEAPVADAAGFPGFAPFTRHARADGAARSGWDIRQRHTHADPKAANQAILEDLLGGVTSIHLVADTGARPSGFGVYLPSLDALEQTLDGVLLDLAPIALDARDEGFTAASLLLALWDRKGYGAEAVSGALNIDPIAALAKAGHIAAPMDAGLARAGAFGAYVAKTRPTVRSLRADSRPYHNAGASEAQELAAMLATGVAYLRALETAGLSVDDACGQILFTLTADTDQFLSIAKLRAARMLWDRITEASGAASDNRAMALHAQTSARMMTRRDPWVNLLRATMACFAAACGGADAITVSPHTLVLGQPDGFARRMARNIQIILMEESGLGRVIDPAGGAWSIEKLTGDLAGEAWALFQEIERDGGIVGTLMSGALSQRIAKVREQRLRNIATRRDPITGISEFPDLFEASVDVERPDLDAIAAAAPAGTAAADLSAVRNTKRYDSDWVAALVAAAQTGASSTAVASALETAPLTQGHLPECRSAESYEALRDAGDHHKTLHGTFPRVAMVTLGRLADFTARAMFTRNLLAAGGIETVELDPQETAEQAAAVFKSAALPIAVLCGAPDVYEAIGAQTIRALRDAGATAVLIAGRPTELDTSAGADRFLYTGCDALEGLRDIHTRLGVIEGGRAMEGGQG